MLRLAPALVAAVLAVTGIAGAASKPPSEARGLPWAGSLVRGVQLPAGGSTFVTWDPVRTRTPNRGWRRWGTDRLVHTVRRVLGSYARAYPWAPPVVVGDLSRPHGGEFGVRFGWPGHASHQNGLDVDVYYPRRDRRLRPPDRPAQIDRRLAQALVTRFVRAGASHVFVGPHTGLRGPRRIVSVLPAFHDNHMHVRLRTRPCTRPLVNRIHAYRLAVPCGWSGRVDAEGSATLASSRTRVRLFAYGPVPGNRPLPGNRRLRLGPPTSFEGVGRARTASFALRGRVFEAVVYPPPAPASRSLRTVTAVLRSVRLTRRAFRIADEHRRLELGRTVEGRPMRAWRIGNPRARRRVLVVGCIHGDECAGAAVTARLVDNGLPLAGELVVVQYLNPDGYARRARPNAHGVDLNRNFPFGWSPMARHGRRPFSEPEVAALRRLVRRFRPDVTVWFHQPKGLVRAWGRSVPAARRYARATGLPFRRLPWVGGSAPQWQNRAFGATSFVVELPPGDLPARAADRHARALLALVR